MGKRVTIDDIDWAKFEKEVRADYEDYCEWDNDLGPDFPIEDNPYHESVIRLSFVLDYLQEKDYEKALEWAIREYGDSDFGGLRRNRHLAKLRRRYTRHRLSPVAGALFN